MVHFKIAVFATGILAAGFSLIFAIIENYELSLITGAFSVIFIIYSIQKEK